MTVAAYNCVALAKGTIHVLSAIAPMFLPLLYGTQSRNLLVILLLTKKQQADICMLLNLI
jgi:hypothetical protein